MKRLIEEADRNIPEVVSSLIEGYISPYDEQKMYLYAFVRDRYSRDVLDIYKQDQDLVKALVITGKYHDYMVGALIEGDKGVIDHFIKMYDKYRSDDEYYNGIDILFQLILREQIPNRISLLLDENKTEPVDMIEHAFYNEKLPPVISKEIIEELSNLTEEFKSGWGFGLVGYISFGDVKNFQKSLKKDIADQIYTKDFKDVSYFLSGVLFEDLPKYIAVYNELKIPIFFNVSLAYVDERVEDYLRRNYPLLDDTKNYMRIRPLSENEIDELKSKGISIEGQYELMDKRTINQWEKKILPYMHKIGMINNNELSVELSKLKVEKEISGYVSEK